MNYNNPIPISLSNLIRISCAALFALFSFFYLYTIQGYVLAAAQYVFSGGVTTYSRFIGALIITAILMLVQHIVSKLPYLSGRWYAFTYAPSFVLLAMLTSLSRDSIQHFTFGSWLWVVPVFVVLYWVFLLLMRRMPDTSIAQGDYTTGRYLWTNFATLLVMMLICGNNAPARDVYLYELKAEQLLVEGDYEGASRVGEKSLDVSPRLNELRMYAIARQGLLGEKLFDYPQPFAEHSLILFDDTITRFSRFTSKDIQESLGAWANSSVNNVDQYLDLLRKNPATKDNALLGDYVLSSKLLQGDIRGFNMLVRKYHPELSNPSAVTTMPRAYREALLLQARAISNDSLAAFADTLMLANYREYVKTRDEETDSLVRANRLRRLFGNTLWWHLDYML